MTSLIQVMNLWVMQGKGDNTDLFFYPVCKQESEADIHSRKVTTKVDILDMSQNSSERMEKSS